MRYLISGADGFLGANLAQRLIENGHDVFGSALNRKGHTSLDALGLDIRLEYGDVRDREFCERMVNAYRPDVVFHLAAVSIVSLAAQDPARAIGTNVMGTVNVLEACKRGGVGRVIVASSDKAYGDHGGVPYTEDMALKPTGVYEVSKAAADHVARLYGAVVTRCANLFGPGDLNWSRLVPGSCMRAVRGQAPAINAGAWDFRREWLDVDSAVDAYILLASDSVATGAYNVGSGQTMTPGDVGCFIAEMAGAPVPCEREALGCYEIPSQILCSDKIAALGWSPSWQLRTALRNTYLWYRQYLERGRAAARGAAKCA